MHEPLRKHRFRRHERHHEVLRAAQAAQAYDSATPDIQALMAAFLPSPIVCDAVLVVVDRPLRLSLQMILHLVEPAMFSGGFHWEPMAMRHLPVGAARQGNYWRGRLGRVSWSEAKPPKPLEQNMQHLSIEQIGRIAYEVNRAYCQSIGDTSHPSWDEAPNLVRESTLMGVRNIVGQGDVLPADLHASWLSQKASEGWTYGEAKDFEAKTHPCMLPYDQLSDTQRAKDRIFRATVLVCLGRAVVPPEALGAERAEAARAQAEAAAREAEPTPAEQQAQADAEAARAAEEDAAVVLATAAKATGAGEDKPQT